MAERLYRAAAADALRIVPLDDFTVIFHRPSGLTHLVTAPAPEILALLSEDVLTRNALLACLGAQFDLGDASAEALDARLGELVATGLVETA
ncbi:HPr-rel-A system PqqD family peptide chaperone [Hephaestia mangrovi]|uniref:HPr-rel-A system PqqD family peptide chaperone n=1 Tax=Hephaestia mangrovi TaxID=2873268 RepID=UPI001CA6F9B2|nr:HPr-rel-A system PqqD family peptide chaperone [Hephaestia mangrovi]